ncbi:hypothetical protein JKP88DRAFT_294491 [Tribonema minus]|uniref:Uncharacterized protein n=1 Tax=Tribonema minus TaxID=303371 RepID=A0A835ZJM5_9STRA|nr:hypothetical protein JKP88DRAFT_294491 [Tribonema minus]
MRPKSDAAPLVIATAAAVTHAVLSASNFNPDSFSQSPFFFPRIRNAAPFAAQVTHLADGGAAVALRISHQLCDGRACFAVAAAWGRLHRGLKLAPPPQHDRAVLQAIAAATRGPDVCECYSIAPPFQAGEMMMRMNSLPFATISGRWNQHNDHNELNASTSAAVHVLRTTAYAGATAEASEWEGRMLSFSEAELGSIKAAATAALSSNTPPSSDTSSLNSEAVLDSTASIVNDEMLSSDTSSLNSSAALRSSAPPPSSTAAAHVDTLCEDAKEHSSAAWISTLDALNGHSWCAVMRARHAAGLIPADALQQPHAVSRLWFTVDGRRRFKLKKGGASLPAGFSGNVYMFSGLVPTPTSFLSTDWRFADAYAIDFGNGQPAKLRRAPMPGRIMACVLPAPPGEGGVEVYMGLRKALCSAIECECVAIVKYSFVCTHADADVVLT